MELLPDELGARLPPLRSIDDKDEPFVFIHYTITGTGNDWYVMHGEPQEDDFVFFGFVWHESRFRYFRLSELEAMRRPSGETVIRDVDFIKRRTQ